MAYELLQKVLQQTAHYSILIFFAFLSLVSVKFAKIVGSAEIHVKVGSTIALTCVVNHQVPSIQW